MKTPLKIVFATNNINKIKEVQNMLPQCISLVSLADIGCLEDIPETANSIEGNAIQKANYISEKYGLNCFADDTGLEVDALHGEPGVFSARYAGEQKNATDNMNKLLARLQGQINRKAHFKTVICLNFNEKQFLFTGVVSGEITLEKLGEGGFGYDPIFRPDGFSETFATLSLTEKNKISHRGLATAKLFHFFSSEL